MNASHCPLCYDKLEVREVAPCMDCGGEPQELEHLRVGKHTYHEFEVVLGHRLVLCNFCSVDFGSYKRSFFGLPVNYPLGYEYMKLIRDITDLGIGKDKYCSSCECRLKFLEFVSAVREEEVK